MGILDEAIREHLELKRQHGAPDSELKQLEDEAFGQAERPGDSSSAAEAPTQFMEQPSAPEGQEPSRREPTIADLQEPPPPPSLPVEEPAAEREPAVEEAPPEEEQPAMEHEIVAETPEAEESAEETEAEVTPAGPTTEEREAIAEQPTEMFDIEEEMEAAPRPSDEEIVEEEIAEPRLAPTDPLAGLEETEEGEATIQGPAPDDDEEYEDEDDAFWNEQRLSDELDQALEAPIREPEPEPEYDDEEPEVDDEDSEPLAEAEPEAEGEADSPDEDVLEETPDFLEESPEDDQLWFEQKPPKDFDFDD
jgi:hypothetical protein